MDDVVKAKYLLSGEAEKFLINKHDFWYYENRMFGGREGPFGSVGEAFEAFIESEEKRKKEVERAKRWHG